MATSITKTFSVDDTVYVRYPYTSVIGFLPATRIVSAIDFIDDSNICVVYFTNGTQVYDSPTEQRVFTTQSACVTAIINDIILATTSAVALEAATLTSTAVKQVCEVTITGSSGSANITFNGTAYPLTFNSSLVQTATDFVTTNASAIAKVFGGASVESTGAIIKFVANKPDVFIYVSNAVNSSGNLAGTVLYTTVASVSHQVATVTLSGTSGTCLVNFNGTDYPLVFDTSLTKTADNFVSQYASSILSIPFGESVVSSSSGTIIFTAKKSNGFIRASVTGLSGSMGGSTAYTLSTAPSTTTATALKRNY